MNFNTIKSCDLYLEVAEGFKLKLDGLHGEKHWQRVYENTQMLAKHYNVKSKVFLYFALLHDSKRNDDMEDLKHGVRASVYAKKLFKQNRLDLTKEEFEILYCAILNHTRVYEQDDKILNNLIFQICLDSDRLDIGRVGIIPDEYYMKTSKAKEIASKM